MFVPVSTLISAGCLFTKQTKFVKLYLEAEKKKGKLKR